MLTTRVMHFHEILSFLPDRILSHLTVSQLIYLWGYMLLFPYVFLKWEIYLLTNASFGMLSFQTDFSPKCLMGLIFMAPKNKIKAK